MAAPAMNSPSGSRKDPASLATAVGEMLSRTRKLADLVEASKMEEPKEKWSTMKRGWETCAVGLIRALSSYSAAAAAGGPPVPNAPNRADIEKELREMHARVKAVFERYDNWREKQEAANKEMQLFKEMDADNSGTIDVSELHQALSNMNLELSEANTQLLLRRIDRRGGGGTPSETLTFAEFRELLAVLIRFKKIFKEADADGSGSISRPELEACFKKLGLQVSAVMLQLFEDIFDADKSGTIDYQEFFNLILFFRELEDQFEKHDNDWAALLLGPSANAADARELVDLVVWNSSLSFNEFVTVVCKKRAQIERRAAVTRRAVSTATPPPGTGEGSGSQIKVGSRIAVQEPSSAPNPKLASVNTFKDLPTKKRVLPDQKLKSVGMLTPEQWLAEYPRPIKKWNDVGHGGVPLPSYPNVDLIKVTEDNLEFGDPAGTLDISTFKFEDMDRFSMFYKDNLYEKPHTNFVGNHPDIGPYLVSLELGTVEKLKCIVRSKKGNQRLLVTPGKSGTLLQALVNACPELKECNLLQVNNPDVQMDCLLFDQKLIASNYKMGVLLVKKDQPDEQSWYNNKDSTPAYEEFLEWLAFRIPMKAWPRFRGGLDSKNDLTGSESYYTNHKGYEIMFHCSALIPYYPNDAQQVERKRHLGNDVVVIIFREADVTEPFDPAKVKSHFNHIFCVVQPVGTPENRSYMIAFSSKLGVQPYSPLLPAGGVYQKNDALRELLLTKLINSERAAMYAPDFKGKGINTRRAVLRDIVNKYVGEATKPQEKSGTPPMMHSASSPAATGKKEEKKGGMFSLFARSATGLFGGHD